MRDCPKCGAQMRGKVCNECGEGRPMSGAPDPNRFLCADEFRGERCANPGVYSPSTVGGGQWYCWQHARHVHGGDRGSFTRGDVPPSVRRAITPKPVDFEDVAERLAIQHEPGA